MVKAEKHVLHGFYRVRTKELLGSHVLTEKELTVLGTPFSSPGRSSRKRRPNKTATLALTGAVPLASRPTFRHDRFRSTLFPGAALPSRKCAVADNHLSPYLSPFAKQWPRTRVRPLTVPYLSGALDSLRESLPSSMSCPDGKSCISSVDSFARLLRRTSRQP